MSLGNKNEPKKVSAFSVRRITGNIDVFNLLQTEITAGKADFQIEPIVQSKPAAKKAPISGCERENIYKYFSSLSSNKPCVQSQRAERIFNDLDQMAAKYSHACENHVDHIILQGLMLLQDALMEDSPPSSKIMRSTLQDFAKGYQKELHSAHAMYEDEDVIQKELIGRMKTYIDRRYGHMPDRNDYESMMLVAKFSKIDPQAKIDLRMYKDSKNAQEDLYAFGVFRVQQIHEFDKWMKSPESDRAINLYKYIRRHRVNNNGRAILSKRLALHG